MIATPAHARGRTKRVSPMSASEAMKSSAPTAARALPLATALTTIAPITTT